MTLKTMTFGIINVLLAIGVFTSTPEVQSFFSTPTGELITESMLSPNGMTTETGEVTSNVLDTTPIDALQEELSRLISVI